MTFDITIRPSGGAWIWELAWIENGHHNPSMRGEVNGPFGLARFIAENQAMTIAGTAPEPPGSAVAYSFDAVTGERT